MIIASLTSYGKRLDYVHLALETILKQTVKPDKIVLWLAHGERVPKWVKEMPVEIRFCHDVKSYNKIIHSLREFPEDIIITFDDDLLYPKNLIEVLMESYRQHPNDISAVRCHRILMNDGRPQSYLVWRKMIVDNMFKEYNFFTSGHGTLFPPHVFNDEVFNEEAFMSLAPRADDVWLNAMARLNHKTIWKTRVISKNKVIEPVQDVALSIRNTSKEHCENDDQIRNVFSKYKILWK